MTSVTGPVGGFGLARGYHRFGMVFTALIFTGMPARTVFDEGWPMPLAHPTSIVMLLIAALVFGAHIAVVRPTGRAAGPAGQALAAVVLLVTVAGMVVVARSDPRSELIWFLVAGQALSVLLAARGWRQADLIGAGATTVVAAVVYTVAWSPWPGRGWVLCLLVIALLAVPSLTDLSSVHLIRLLDRLDQARRMAHELATARERARIAAELHDVQGHSLHAIALHAELTERLLESDPAAATAHARTVRTLAADALAETRALVRGYRDAELDGELRNAAKLLRAAGADARVDGDPAAVPAAHAALLGPVVREAATNVLRHSDPAKVRFTVRRVGDRTEMEVRNDGVPDTPDGADPHGGTGLAGLRTRIGEHGGRVEAGPDGDRGWRLRVILLDGVDETRIEAGR